MGNVQGRSDRQHGRYLVGFLGPELHVCSVDISITYTSHIHGGGGSCNIAGIIFFGVVRVLSSSRYKLIERVFFKEGAKNHSQSVECARFPRAKAKLTRKKHCIMYIFSPARLVLLFGDLLHYDLKLEHNRLDSSSFDLAQTSEFKLP